MDKIGQGERAPWGNFPPVIRNGDLGDLTKEPEYQAAKAGNSEAAFNLVSRLLKDETISAINQLIGDRSPLLLPVLALEAGGTNKIPLMMAMVLGAVLDLDVEVDIVQREKVSRTGSGADHRLVFQPTFEGRVVPGKEYVILDDTLTMGGTIASLRGYVENCGGNVIGATVMSAYRSALDIAVTPLTLYRVQKKHGNIIDEFWKEHFGYGIDRLTEGEAGHLQAAKSFDAIRDRLVAARNDGGEHMGRREAETTAEHLAAPNQAVGALNTAAQAEQRSNLQEFYDHLLFQTLQAKGNQADRLQGWVGRQIVHQQTAFDKHESRKPGKLALPSTKKQWHEQFLRSRKRLQQLYDRQSLIQSLSGNIHSIAEKIVSQDFPEVFKELNVIKRQDSQQTQSRKESLIRKHSYRDS